MFCYLIETNEKFMKTIDDKEASLIADTNWADKDNYKKLISKLN